MNRRRILCLLLSLFLLLPAPLLAQGLSGLLPLPSLPDPAPLLGEEPTLYQCAFYEQGRQQFDAYAFSVPDSISSFLSDYGALLANSGYALAEGVWDNRYLCYRIQQSERMGGALIFDDADHLLLLVLRDMAYRPLPDEATSAPAQASSPTSGSSSSWAWVIQTLPCPQCHSTGSCKLCHGTGIYRLYGQNVECDKRCSFCQGTGVYEVTQYLPVP